MKNTVWLTSYPTITDASIVSSAVLFEEEIGLNPFVLSPDEVDLYRPELYRILSENNPSGIQYKKVHDAYIRNQNNVPLFPPEVWKLMPLIRN